MVKVKIFTQIHDLNGSIPSLDKEINIFLELCKVELIKLDYSIQDSSSDLALSSGYGNNPRIIECAILTYKENDTTR